MKRLKLTIVLCGLQIFWLYSTLARESCGDENLKKWIVCKRDKDCMVELIPCAQIRSINKKYMKASKASQDCLSIVAGPCMPDTIEPKVENFRAICKANACFAEAIK